MTARAERGWFPCLGLLFMLCWGCSGAALASEDILIPRIGGEWRTIATNPDLGALTSPAQEPVDFAVWQAADGTWQLQSCIRYTKEEGRTRLFYRWQAASPYQPGWRPVGIVMHADPDRGELPGGLMAPFVLPHHGLYYMFYSSGLEISLATSSDGKTFERYRGASGSGLFSEPLGAWDEATGRVLATHARDPMVLRVEDRFHCYYTADTLIGEGGDFREAEEGVYVRTSRDLLSWGPSQVVRRGGSAGSKQSSAESPFVFQHRRSGAYYLFTTQRYGEDAQTSVYRSTDPRHFGLDQDEGFLVARLPVAAPEILEHEERTWLAALTPDLEGIRLVLLEWVPRP